MVGDIFQPTHLLFILVIALLVLGPKRLPEVGRQLGNGIRDFRAAINGERHGDEEEIDPPPYEPDIAAAPPQATEHEFGHEAAEAVADDQHLADGAGEPAPAAPDAAQEEAPTVVSPDAARATDEHELAYDRSSPSEKRSDPSS